jgi:hypothetical protein
MEGGDVAAAVAASDDKVSNGSKMTLLLLIQLLQI